MEIEQNLHFISKATPKRQYKRLLHAPLDSMVKDPEGNLSKHFNICKDSVHIGLKRPDGYSISEDEMKQSWRYIAKRIKIHHWNKSLSLRELKINLEISLNESAKVLGREISKNWTHLHRLEIGSFRGGCVKKEELEDISKEANRRKLKHIKEIELHFGLGGGPKDDIKYQDLKWFTRRNFFQIQQLKLKRISDEKIDDAWLTGFIPKLGDSLNRLKGLSIELFSCPKITDQGLNAFSQGISKKFRTLNELDLKFYNFTSITLKDSSLFGNQTLPYLTTLSLNFDSCHGINNEGFVKLLTGIENTSQSLKDLSLRFRECNRITDEGLKMLGTSLKNLSNLERLLLNFKSCRSIRNDGLTSLASEGFVNLTKLKKLTLCFNKCQGIENEGICSLSNGVDQYLTQLENLAIYCWDVKISPEYLKEFILNIIGKLTHLKNFNLNNLGFERSNVEGELRKNGFLKNFLEESTPSAYFYLSSDAEMRALRDESSKDLAKLFDLVL